MEVIDSQNGPGASASASKKGYDCCSKREKSSAFAALIGCISLGILMTSLVTDLWLDTDELIIPSVEIPQTSSDSGPNVQPRHEADTAAKAKRVHFAVGLWTVCPSHQDGYKQGKTKIPQSL